MVLNHWDSGGWVWLKAGGIPDGHMENVRGNNDLSGDQLTRQRVVFPVLDPEMDVSRNLLICDWEFVGCHGCGGLMGSATS
jgi:hypothetical protein